MKGSDKMTREKYNIHPKHCLNCGSVIPYEKRTNKFCNSSCSCIYNNNKRVANGWKPSDEQRRKVSTTLKNKPLTKTNCCRCGKEVWVKCVRKNVLCDECRGYKLIFDKTLNKFLPHCNVCGAVKGQCKRPDICKHVQLLKSMVKYFGFDKTAIGTERVYEEFEKCRNLLIEEYWDNNLSLPEIVEKYHHKNVGTLGIFFKHLNIPIRNRSQGQTNAIRMCKRDLMPPPPKYHFGHHIDWQGNNWFFRSSYEEKQMIEYDSKNINYKVEALRILYYDTSLCRQRVAIPDFYLPDTNEIVEIKSNYTYNEQNMKDKFKAYVEHGFKPKLILDFKEVEVNIDN